MKIYLEEISIGDRVDTIINNYRYEVLGIDREKQLVHVQTCPNHSYTSWISIDKVENVWKKVYME